MAHRRSFPNIESVRAQRGMVNPHYPAYSNLGVCRVFGSSGRWWLTMGNSSDLAAQGLSGRQVYSGPLPTLADVSRALESLEVRYRPDCTPYVVVVD